MRFLNTILEVVFPSRCISCGSRGAELCVPCLSSSPEAERESAEWIFPLYDYRHPPIKKSLWFLKYKGKRRLTQIFALNLYDKIMEELSDLTILQNFTEPLLIPIPLSKKSLRERGFNQAELLCNELCKIDIERSYLQKTNFSLNTKILIKSKDTLHQARLRERSQRIKNIAGAFSIQDISMISGKNIILIDDILTTGATLGEARKVLKQGGARKVIAFTIAH